MNIAIIVGLTASGKSTVLTSLCDEHNFEKLVTTTTRNPRPGEVDGIDYYFIDKDSFEEKQKNGFFLESVFVKGNYYGSGLNSFQKDFGNNVPAIILDPVGAKEAFYILKKEGHNPKTIFINESPETCIERVLSRDSDADEQSQRLTDITTVEQSWATHMEYDFTTKPLSSIDDNCHDIKSFMNKFDNKIVRKVENKKRNSNRI